MLLTYVPVSRLVETRIRGDGVLPIRGNCSHCIECQSYGPFTSYNYLLIHLWNIPIEITSCN